VCLVTSSFGSQTLVFVILDSFSVGEENEVHVGADTRSTSLEKHGSSSGDLSHCCSTRSAAGKTNSGNYEEFTRYVEKSHEALQNPVEGHILENGTKSRD
jgi:hypothetical protein